MPEAAYAVRGCDPDDVQATLRFANGAIGAITYVTGGNARYPKETFDAADGGRSARLENFRRASVWAGRRRAIDRARGGQDKGQRNQVASFVAAIRAGQPMPIPLDSLFATTRATIAVGESLASGQQEPA